MRTAGAEKQAKYRRETKDVRLSTYLDASSFDCLTVLAKHWKMTKKKALEKALDMIYGQVRSEQNPLTGDLTAFLEKEVAIRSQKGKLKKTHTVVSATPKY